VAVGKRIQATSLTNITTAVQPFDAPVPAAVAAGGLDLVTLMFNYHDLEWMKVDRAKMNRAVFAALKPGGIYVIADHAGRTGTGVTESNTLHRIDEDVVRKEVLAAGFAMSAEGNFLRNPADPRDRETPEGGIKKDEFVLKFIKP
jgi:predicted methyltransferase